MNEADRRLGIANERVVKLEATQRPRRILKEAWPSLLSSAKFPPGLSVRVNGVSSDPEISQLATDAAEFFHSAGLQTELNLPVMGGDSSAPSGVVIFTSRSYKGEFGEFRDALIALGIQCHIKIAGYEGKPDFSFTVAPKPTVQ